MEPKTVEEFLAAMQAIIDGAEGRSLSDDEVTQYEKLEGGLQRARSTDEIQKRQAAYNTPATPALVTSDGSPRGDDTLERAFEHFLRTGKENSDLVELRAQSEGTSSAGGYLVPKGFRDKLVERMKAFAGLANVVEEITTTSGQPLEWPTIDDTANSGAIVAENGAPAGGADLVFGTATLGAYKYMSVGAGGVPLKVSVELLQDSAVDVQSLVARKLGERIARAQSPHWVSGTGTGQPKGLVTGKTATVAATLTYGTANSIIHALDPAYRMNAVWAMNDATLALFEGVVDTTGRPILRSANPDGTPGSGITTILGYPVVIDQAFATYAPGPSTAIGGAFGDLREGYVIRRVRDVQLVVDPYSFATNGQVGFTAWARADGTQQNPNSYVVFAGA
jgi:HK97 family phage major capsid protein